MGGSSEAVACLVHTPGALGLPLQLLILSGAPSKDKGAWQGRTRLWLC